MDVDCSRMHLVTVIHEIYRAIEASLSIGGTIIHLNVHEHLFIKNICSPWVPNNFVDWGKEMFTKFSRGNSKHVCNIIDDKSWIVYAYERVSKLQSIERVFHAHGRMFFRKSGNVATVIYNFCEKALLGHMAPSDYNLFPNMETNCDVNVFQHLRKLLRPFNNRDIPF